MCLSTVYRNEKSSDAILMRNVTEIECEEGQVILTDLMENQLTIPGKLKKANLVEGYVIVLAD